MFSLAVSEQLPLQVISHIGLMLSLTEHIRSASPFLLSHSLLNNRLPAFIHPTLKSLPLFSEHNPQQHGQVLHKTEPLSLSRYVSNPQIYNGPLISSAITDDLTMATADETDMNEFHKLTKLKTDLQVRLENAAESLAIKQAEVEELRQKVEEAKKKHEAGLKKLHTMGYKLENGKAVPRFDADIISDEQAEDIKLSWEEFKDKVEKCDYQFGHYLMGLFHNLAARDDPNLAARLESYKEYRNARAKDVTECKMIESL